MAEQLKLRWPADWTKLHVYFVPDPVQIKPVVDAYRNLIAELDFVAAQPDEWLHATVLVVDGVAARDVTADQRAELVERLQSASMDIPAFTVTCGPAVEKRSSIAVEMVPDGGFAELVDRVKAAAGEVFGADAVRYTNGAPHITLGYATGEGLVETPFPDVRVRLTVDSVRLVDVLVDTELFQFRWEELAVLPLKKSEAGS